MTRHTERTRLFVAVSAVLAQGIILAAEGENAAAEIREMSCNPEEWSSLADDMPKEPGLYVWEGQALIEDGVGMGEYGGRGEADFEWSGAWRVAKLQDLLGFNFHHSAPVCPAHNTPRERAEGGALFCRLCLSDAGRMSVAARRKRAAALRAGRELKPHLPDHASIQCPECWLVHSRTDLKTDGNVCRECNYHFINVPPLAKEGVA